MFEQELTIILSSPTCIVSILMIVFAILMFAVLSGVAKVVKAEEGSRIEIVGNSEDEIRQLKKTVEKFEERLTEVRSQLHCHEKLESE